MKGLVQVPWKTWQERSAMTNFSAVSRAVVAATSAACTAEECEEILFRVERLAPSIGGSWGSEYDPRWVGDMVPYNVHYMAIHKRSLLGTSGYTESEIVDAVVVNDEFSDECFDAIKDLIAKFESLGGDNSSPEERAFLASWDEASEENRFRQESAESAENKEALFWQRFEARLSA